MDYSSLVEISNINGLAVGIAVGGEAKSRLGFVVKLQARGSVVVERAL